MAWPKTTSCKKGRESQAIMDEALPFYQYHPRNEARHIMAYSHSAGIGHHPTYGHLDINVGFAGSTGDYLNLYGGGCRT